MASVLVVVRGMEVIEFDWIELNLIESLKLWSADQDQWTLPGFHHDL